MSRQIIAAGLLLVVAFIVVNPLCECYDHMDNLRHLGSHGILIVLLMVALAGISLLQSLHWFLLPFVSSIVLQLPWSCPIRISTSRFLFALSECSILPLRV